MCIRDSYKTGSSSSYAQLADDPVAAGRLVQLALYAEAVRGALGTDFEVGSAYWFISSRGGFERISLPAAQATVDERLRTVLRTVAGGIRNGVFPQVPGEIDEFRDTFANCRYCDYTRVCPNGRDQQWERKQRSTLCLPYRSLALEKPQP